MLDPISKESNTQSTLANIFIPSTNYSVLVYITFATSLIHNINNSGSKLDSWGAPEETFKISEMYPLTETYDNLVDR